MKKETERTNKMNIPFSPPDIGEKEINEVVDTLKSGWITTGPKTKKFETEIAKFCHSIGLNVWCYTGYTMEYLLRQCEKENNLREFLENIDVLVDSPFILELKSYNVPFRGSSNQRIIDSKKSVEENRVCLVAKYEN